ncbi:MAG: 4Fe-4S cluster-binding domain-containing protein [Spirochaetaceae bacterium]|jgi:putative pyruvate formate lyase activating enzyme|nr:4Fe-4S cluster-binding domain-containing protein [Spirochaetaceae bacterium]
MSNNIYAECVLCPRLCRYDRRQGYANTILNTCREGETLRLASAVVHHGEEPPVCGPGGSGAVFVTGCSLRCAYCQNVQISQRHVGAAVDRNEFVRICLALQSRGAENINIVTGSHAAPAIADGLYAAKAAGLTLPILWNTSAYETSIALNCVRDLVDVYLPDLKMIDPSVADKYIIPCDYPCNATRTIERMLSLRPGNVIIRHLVMPNQLESTRDVLKWFNWNAKGRAKFSLMTQYTPPLDLNYYTPARRITREEYDAALSLLEEFDIQDGYYQEWEAESPQLPDFTQVNPFPGDLARPVWHWSCGFVKAE